MIEELAQLNMLIVSEVWESEAFVDYLLQLLREVIKLI